MSHLLNYDFANNEYLYSDNLKVATFKDGSTAEVDVVMMCTGYLHSYPFLRFYIIRMIIVVVLIIMTNREDLRMKSKNLLYPAGMYKGMVWTAGKSRTRVFWVSRKCPGNGKFISKQDENMIVIMII